jgi:hypothetical protein
MCDSHEHSLEVKHSQRQEKMDKGRFENVGGQTYPRTQLQAPVLNPL